MDHLFNICVAISMTFAPCLYKIQPIFPTGTSRLELTGFHVDTLHLYLTKVKRLFGRTLMFFGFCA